MDQFNRHNRLEGKRAIVTGAAAGLGEAIARMFAREAAAVACLDKNRESNEAVADSIRSVGGSAFPVSGDVSIGADVERLVHEAEEALGGIDVLVNNAGVIPSRESVVNTTESDWDLTMRVNVKGVFLMSKAVIPSMVRQGGGSIINLSSITGLVGLPVRAAYSASKGAVSILTRQMAVDFGKHNIRVNAINPSFVVTDLTRELFERMKAEVEPWRALMEQHPLGRLGEPEDVAQAAIFLAADESRWITGVLLPIDGGYTAR